jgi:hypothetical protein
MPKDQWKPGRDRDAAKRAMKPEKQDFEAPGRLDRPFRGLNGKIAGVSQRHSQRQMARKTKPKIKSKNGARCPNGSHQNDAVRNEIIAHLIGPMKMRPEKIAGKRAIIDPLEGEELMRAGTSLGVPRTRLEATIEAVEKTNKPVAKPSASGKPVTKGTSTQLASESGISRYPKDYHQNQQVRHTILVHLLERGLQKINKTVNQLAALKGETLMRCGIARGVPLEQLHAAMNRAGAPAETSPPPPPAAPKPAKLTAQTTQTPSIREEKQARVAATQTSAKPPATPKRRRVVSEAATSKKPPKQAGSPKMRALSIRQPFAELVMAGEKTVEYRSKVTRIRGRVYVYACKSRNRLEHYEDAGLGSDKLPHGKLVGTVEIVNCIQGDDGYEWHLTNPKRLKKKLTVTGVPQPGFFWPFGR